MQQLTALYHAIAQRIVDKLNGKFKVEPFDSQGDTKKGLPPFCVVVQFPDKVSFSASGGALGGRYIRDGNIRLYVKVSQGQKYLDQLSFLEAISNALHTWTPPGLGLAPIDVRDWELDDRGPGSDFRMHTIDAKFSGYARGTNLAELGPVIDPETEVYLSVELAAEEEG